MDQSTEKQDLTRRRKADFYTSILLLALAASMLLETLTFPMSDSYGGVENEWYVSPALFPMIVAGSLAIMAFILMRRAITDGGARRAWQERTRILSAWRDQRFQRLLMIIASIAAYVYGLVSYVDFFLASALFLLTFIVPFYLDHPALLRVHVLGLTGAGLISFVLERGPVISGNVLDTLIVGIYLALCLYGGWLTHRDKALWRKWRTTVLVSILTPLVLVPCFKFGLLVPLPVEGIAINAMVAIAQHLPTIF